MKDQSWTSSEKVNWFLLLLLFVMSFVRISNAGNDYQKFSDGLKPPSPRANNASPLVQDKYG